MTNRQITEMMRDIAPQYQNKANERAASVRHTTRRSMIPQLLAGGAALSCAAFSLAFIIPNMQQSGLTQPDSQIENLAELTEDDAAGSPANAPFGNLFDAVIRLASPAYAPYALELPAEAQQNLAQVLSEANWNQTATISYDEVTFTDGESVIMNIYDPNFPLCMVFSGQNNEVRVSDFASGNWRIYETSEKAVRAVRDAAGIGCNAPEGSLTWVQADTLTTPDFWKNFRVEAKVCNMSDKADVFYKMTNPMDYYDRVSGVVMSGGNYELGCGIAPNANYFMQRTEFQADLNMAKAYNVEDYYYGDNIDQLFGLEEGVIKEDGYYTCAMDGDFDYTIYKSENKYSKYEHYGHRIDYLPYDNILPHDTDMSVDMWCSYQPRLICNGIGMESLYSIGTIVSYLNNFNNWEIVGTEEINGRSCVHIQGQAPDTDNELVFFKDSAAHVTHFDMYADEATGVLVRLRGYDDTDKVTRFIETTDLAFDNDAEPVIIPDFSTMEEETYDTIPVIPFETEEAAEAYGSEVPVTIDPEDAPADVPAEPDAPAEAVEPQEKPVTDNS